MIDNLLRKCNQNSLRFIVKFVENKFFKESIGITWAVGYTIRYGNTSTFLESSFIINQNHVILMIKFVSKCTTLYSLECNII